MSAVTDFELELKKRSEGCYATWHRVDLHNHSPSSHDYKGDRAQATAKTAERIRETDLSILMFTDHWKLPAKEFVEEVSQRSGKLVVRGTELNVFVDAWLKPKNKIDKRPFFHLLVGFDPKSSYSAEFWLDKIYQECGREEFTIGSDKIVGVSSGIDKILKVLDDSGAILIPAHLHSAADAFRSRSIDDIYDDPSFLSYVPHFHALEVTNPKTATFFDGAHTETNHISISCIRSSDAHAPEELGVRPSWVQMQTPSFSELRASLEFRFRVSLQEPKCPDAYILGLHVQGQFLQDFWLPLSPHCNVFIGVKGSGKTSALECLRFVLGAEVPKVSRDQVRAHLTHILGPNGRVRVLLRRRDSSLVLVERSMANPDRFEMTFESGRTEVLSQVDAVNFSAQILGWHEIEHAATDSSVRRYYLDAIAGRHEVNAIQVQAKAKAEEIRSIHEQASSRLQSYRTLNKQVEAQEQLRRGLQELTDAKLIELKAQYEAAVSHLQEMAQISEQTVQIRRDQAQQIGQVVPYKQPILPGDSPLEQSASRLRAEIQKVIDAVNRFSTEFANVLQGSEKLAGEIVKEAEQRFADFAKSYEEAVNKLNPDQRKLLETHQQVLEQTRQLPNLRAQRDRAKSDVETHLRQLVSLCDEVIRFLDQRTDVRRKAVETFGKELLGSGVMVELKSWLTTDSHQDYSSRY